MRKVIIAVLAAVLLLAWPVLAASDFQTNIASNLVIDYKDMYLHNSLETHYHPGTLDAGLKLNITANWMPSLITQTFTVDLQELYVKKEFQFASLTLGRKQVVWGPGYFSGLVLSKTSPALDQVAYGLKFDRFRYQRFYSMLELAATRNIQLEDGQPPVGDKELLGHRLEVDVMPGLTLGVSETAVLSGPVDILFYNPFPLWPIYLSQHIVTAKDHQQVLQQVNCAISGDFKYTLANRTQIYGELYVDDAPQKAEDNVVDKRGGLFGFYTPKLTDNADLRVEYARIHNYVYSHRENPKLVDYTQYGELLGHISGPDSDMLNIESNIRVSSANKLIFGLNIHQKGEGSIKVDWAEDPDWQKKKFLSGTVEKTFEVKIGVENEIKGAKNYGCTLSLYHAENYQNEQDATNTGFKLSFEKAWDFGGRR